MSYIVLIGYPLRHSVSPVFQQAALDYHGLDTRYEAWEAASIGELERALEKMRNEGCLGGNVTVPYKEAVLPLLDEVDEVSRRIGAVNTVVATGNRLVGSNTDVEGFLEGLVVTGGFDPVGKRVVMLGAGGVARAAGYGLAGRGVASLVISSRSWERAASLAADLGSHVAGGGGIGQSLRTSVVAVEWETGRSGENLRDADLIVNCTTVGMRHGPSEGESLLRVEDIPRGVLVYDLVYNPWPTPLLRRAEEAGAAILGGLSMLVYQGAASFELWTGRKAPVELMMRKARGAVLRNGVV